MAESPGFYRPKAGDHFAGIVRDSTFGQRATGQRPPLTEVIVTKDAGSCNEGCPDSFKGEHIHVATGERKLRPRTVLVRRFDLSGQRYPRQRVRAFAGHGRYYLVQKAEA